MTRKKYYLPSAFPTLGANGLGRSLAALHSHLEETCWHYKATNVRLAFTSPVVFPPSSPSMFVCIHYVKELTHNKGSTPISPSARCRYVFIPYYIHSGAVVLATECKSLTLSVPFSKGTPILTNRSPHRIINISNMKKSR